MKKCDRTKIQNLEGSDRIYHKKRVGVACRRHIALLSQAEVMRSPITWSRFIIRAILTATGGS